MRACLLLFFLAFAASSVLCQGPTSPFEPFAIPASPRWRSAIENGTRLADGNPGPEYWSNRAHYELKVRLDPETATVSGEARLSYTNGSPKSLKQLVVHLRQNLHRAGIRRTRVVETNKGVTLGAIKLEGKELTKGFRKGYSLRGSVMRVRLPKPLAPGKTTILDIEWSYQVPTAGKAPRNGHEDHHVFYLGYWYPQFAVCDDVEGWVADQYLGNGEFYMDYADYDIEFTVPRRFMVQSTGTLENPSEVLTKSARRALKRAASQDEVVSIIGPDREAEDALRKGDAQGLLTWKFKASKVRDVAVSISDRYHWDATRALVKDRDGPGRDAYCAIHALYEPKVKAWRRAAEYARFTIEWMSKNVHPYPWPHMTACEGIIGGGMEYPMMTVVGSRSERGTRGTISHELVHMWFPMLIGQNEKRYAWMDEGMTTFFSGRIVRDFTKNRAKRLPTRGYTRRGGSAFEEPCMRHSDQFNMSSGAFSFAAYTKPAAVFHQLREMVGHEAFDAAIRDYAQRWAYKHPYPEDFFASMSNSLDRDLAWYFRTWMYETWTMDVAPVSIKILSRQKSEVVIQNFGAAVGPTVVEVTLSSGEKLRQTISEQWWLAGHKTKILKFAGKVSEVQTDPDLTTLDINRKNNKITIEK
ncbi:MAG: M1 family metallopeptidase [Planctomycetota bacterium]